MDTPAQPQYGPAISLGALAKALGDVTRLRILKKLAEGEPLMTLEIARALGIPATNASKHLAVLRKAGVVVKGRADLYRVAPHWTVPGSQTIDFGIATLQLHKQAP
jgi:predicted transcriptional regulator